MNIGKLFMGLFTLLSGCAGSIDGTKYVEMQPKFDLRDYFTGPIKAWGIIQDRSGNVITRFDVDMVGRWDGNNGILEEVFTYYRTGEKQTRTWSITKIDDTNYTGRAGDIVGIAQGKSFGNAIQWTYEMDVPVDGTTRRLRFDDWIWAMNDDVVINRSYLKKFGFTVAELTIFMQKR